MVTTKGRDSTGRYAIDAAGDSAYASTVATAAAPAPSAIDDSCGTNQIPPTAIAARMPLNDATTSTSDHGMSARSQCRISAATSPPTTASSSAMRLYSAIAAITRMPATSPCRNSSDAGMSSHELSSNP